MNENTNNTQAPFNQGAGLRPIPDPTILTTQQLTREITTLKDLMSAQISALRELMFATFKTHEGLFDAISVRFHERDTRFNQAEQNSKDAVSAALQAQKDSVAEQNRASEQAIAKAEAATMKQIDQIHLLLQASTNSLDGKINDIKDRITSIEGKTLGHAAATETHDTSHTQWVGLGGLILGTLIGIAGLFVAFNSVPLPPQVVERVIVNPAPGAGTGLP
jgi:hypothetical protein